MQKSCACTHIIQQVSPHPKTAVFVWKDKRTSLQSLSPLFQRKIYSLSCSFLGSQSEVLKRFVESCVSKFYGFVNLRVIFNNTCRIFKSFFAYKDRISRSQRSKVVYKANASINSSGAHPPPPRVTARHLLTLSVPGVGHSQFYRSPEGWALAYPGATSGHLTHVFSK